MCGGTPTTTAFEWTDTGGTLTENPELSVKLTEMVAVGSRPIPAIVNNSKGGSEVLSSDVIVMVGPDSTLIEEEADIEGSATLIAVIVSGFGVGTLAGGAYMATFVLAALVVMIPTVGFPLVTPFTAHVTSMLLAPVTTAVSCSDMPVCTVPDFGETDTNTVGGTMVAVAEADKLGVAWLETVTVMVLGLGTLAGAV
jgi:hypothetical protein